MRQRESIGNLVLLLADRASVLHNEQKQERTMPLPRRSTTARAAAGKTKKKATTKKSGTKKPQRRNSRLNKADMQALTLLDQLVAEDRRVEQQFNLPFRLPRQVATSFQSCAHCDKDIALLIFGDFAKDIEGLKAYARLIADLIE